MSSTQAGPSRAGRGSNGGTDRAGYDPKQDADEKRALRKAYRDVIAKTEDARGNLAQYETNDLKDLVAKADELRGKVKAPNEGILDSKLLFMISETAANKARDMKLNTNAFDVDEYINRLATFIGGSARRATGGRSSRATAAAGPSNGNRRRQRVAANNSDESEEDEDDVGGVDEDVDSWHWMRLGKLAARHSRRAPTMDHLLGPLAIQAKVRQTTKRARLDKDEEEVEPDKLTAQDIDKSEAETTALVRQIAKLLEERGGNKGCGLFEFAINPESFSNTIENLFYISFLVRDGLVSIDVDEEDPNGQPLVLASEAPSEEEYAQGLKKRQIVMELDMKTYRNLIAAYNIKKSIIPTRKPVAKKLGGKWYG